MFLGLSFLEIWFAVTASLLLTYITTNGLEDEKGADDSEHSA